VATNLVLLGAVAFLLGLVWWAWLVWRVAALYRLAGWKAFVGILISGQVGGFLSGIVLRFMAVFVQLYVAMRY
jgi:hypothetical protein